MSKSLRAFARFLAHRRSPRTVKTYVAVLTNLEGWRPGGLATSPSSSELEAFLARPRATGFPAAPATRNQELAALRAFSAVATRELGWSNSPTDGVPFAREAPRDPPVLSAPELRRLFTMATEASPTRLRSRNLAILAMLSQTGLRVHELVGTVSMSNSSISRAPRS